MNENAVEGEVVDEDQEKGLAAIPQAGAIAPIGDGLSIEEFQKQMNDQLRKFEIFEATTLKRTTAEDWLQMGKGEDAKPYLSEPGCRKLMSMWGISILPDTTQFSIELDPDNPDKKFVLCEKVFSCPKLGVIAEKHVGMAATDDAFLRSRGGYDAIKKKSNANCTGRGVRAILGLGNISWAKLAEVGIKREDCGKVEFTDKGKFENLKLDPEKIEHLRACIRLLPDVNNDKDLAKKKLRELTSYSFKKDGKEVQVAGVDSTAKIKSEKSLDYAIRDAEKQLKAAGIQIPEKG